MTAAVLVVALQETDFSNNKQFTPYVRFSSPANQMDASADQDLFTLDVESLHRVCLKFTVAVAALTAFKIHAQFNPEDTVWVPLRILTGDFSTPKAPLIDATSGIFTQAAGVAYIILDVSGISKLKIAASSAGAPTVALSGGGC